EAHTAGSAGADAAAATRSNAWSLIMHQLFGKRILDRKDGVASAAPDARGELGKVLSPSAAAGVEDIFRRRFRARSPAVAAEDSRWRVRSTFTRRHCYALCASEFGRNRAFQQSRQRIRYGPLIGEGLRRARRGAGIGDRIGLWVFHRCLAS